jgi:hypothetical protein
MINSGEVRLARYVACMGHMTNAYAYTTLVAEDRREGAFRVTQEYIGG